MITYSKDIKDGKLTPLRDWHKTVKEMNEGYKKTLKVQNYNGKLSEIILAIEKERPKYEST